MVRCVMALIRSFPSLRPCPRCLIVDQKLGQFSEEAPLRTVEAGKATLEEARGKQLLGDKEEVLKASGMRDVDVRP